MRISFQEELAQLEAGLQEEGDLVLRALRSALNALARGDDELADDVIAFDDEVDRRYARIEEGVQSLLALEAFSRAPTSQARSALVGAIEEPLIAALRPLAGEVNAVAFSPDGRLVAVGAKHGAVPDLHTGSDEGFRSDPSAKAD